MKKLPIGPEDQKVLATALKKLSFFSKVGPDDLDRVVSVAHLYAVEGGRKTVFKKGHIGDALYVIKSGAVEIIKPRFPSPQRPIARLGPGASFGEMALLNQPYRTRTAVTDGYTELFVILASDFHAIFNSTPEFLTSLLKIAKRRRSVAT